MAPSTMIDTPPESVVTNGKKSQQNGVGSFAYTPLKKTGALDAYRFFETTPCIGREYVDVSLKEWMRAEDSDAKLRDLAITIAERGVVYFRGQSDIDGDLQKELALRLSKLSGAPEEHGFYKHIMHELRGDDPEMGYLDPATQAKHLRGPASGPKQSCATEWHTDTAYEVCTPDFTMLRMVDIPRTGGDTMWASCYELYDRLSRPYQKFYEGLTVHHLVPSLKKAAAELDVYKGARGSPQNLDLAMEADHPLVRTHPVTGWKALYPNPLFSTHVNDVTELESAEILKKIQDMVVSNHDLQARFHWENSGDIAVWDNRCVLHAATQDCYGHGRRSGYRTMTIAERPFLDPNSLSRLQTEERNGS